MENLNKPHVPTPAAEDNDDAIVGTILSRRKVLSLAARSGLGLALGGLLLPSAEAAYQIHAQKTVKLVASPAVTEGPFYVDEKLNRSDLIGKTARASVANGVPLSLTFTLYRFTNGKFAPLKGATVDVWQADAQGVYSDQSAPMNHENTAGQNWLRGYQISDVNGLVHFKTIFPGWYESRTTHIHFKVREPVSASTLQTASSAKDGQTAKTKEFTSQLFFDDTLADKIFAQVPYRARGARQVRNTNDMVYTEQQAGGTQAGVHLLVDLKPSKNGRSYYANFAVALTDDNLRSGGRGGRPGFGGGPGGPPPPGGFGDGPPGPPPGGFGDW